MTGPEHYAEAERLIALSKEVTSPIATAEFKAEVLRDPEQTMRVIETTVRMSTALLSEAQVHATLALAAATAYPAIKDYCGGEATDPREWTKAAS